jgi:hypothetical protein
VCFLTKQKGDTPTECESRILLKRDVPTERTSIILLKGDAHCGGASPFYLICTQKNKALQIILHGNVPCASTWGAHWHGYAKHICANSHPVAQCKKHHVEHSLSKIFELFGLARVLKLVSITSSRRGATKFLYCVVHV